MDVSEAEIDNAVKLANGNYIKALEFVYSSDERIYNFELFQSWMRLCYKKDIPGIMEWVDKISMLGREKKKAFLTYALDLIRQNFLLNQVPEYEDRFIRLPQDENLFAKNFSPFIREHNINQLSQLINKAISDIEANAYPKTVFLDSSIQVMGLIGR